MRNRPHQFTSAFPGGWPGVGLLLLRVEIGLTALLEGGAYIGRNDPALWTWAIGSLAIAGGLSLLIGFLTPVASAIVALATILIAVFSVSTPPANLFNAILPT